MKLSKNFFLGFLILSSQNSDSCEFLKRRASVIVPTILGTGSAICVVIAARTNYLLNNNTCQGSICPIIERDVFANVFNASMLFILAGGALFVCRCAITRNNQNLIAVPGNVDDQA